MGYRLFHRQPARVIIGLACVGAAAALLACQEDTGEGAKAEPMAGTPTATSPLTPTAVATHDAWGVLQEKYTITYLAESTREVWVADLRGNARRFLTEGSPCVGASALWSPTGQHLACLTRSPEPKLFVVGLDGRVLWSAGRDGKVFWSPSGQHLVIEAPDEAAGEGSVVYRLFDLVGKQVGEVPAKSAHIVTESRTIRDAGLPWTPGGDGFAFLTRTEEVGIYRIVDGSTLTGPKRPGIPLAWVMKGRALLFASNIRPGVMRVRYEAGLYDTVTGASERVPELDDSTEFWVSPDGQSVVLVRLGEPRGPSLQVLDLLSRQSRPLVGSIISFGGDYIPLDLLRFSSDGARVYWFDFDQTRFLYRADVASGLVTVLWKPETRGGVSFSPDGREVVYVKEVSGGPPALEAADTEQYGPIQVGPGDGPFAWRVLP